MESPPNRSEVKRTFRNSFWNLITLQALTASVRLVMSEYTVEVLSPATTGLISPGSMPLTAPAFDLAMSELERDYSHQFRINITYIANSSLIRSCNDLAANIDLMTAEYYYHRTHQPNLTVLAFPGCAAADTVSISQLAMAWQHLVIIGFYSDPIFHNKAFYPTVIAAAATSSRNSLGAVISFIFQFKWRIVYIVADVPRGSGTVANSGSASLAAALHEVRSAYESVFVVAPTPSVTPSTEKAREILFRRLIEGSKLHYNYSYATGFLPGPNVLSTYSTLKILGEMLAEILRTHQIPDAGRLARRMMNHSFDTNVGTLEFDAAGERIVRFDVKQLDWNSGTFQTVLRQQMKTTVLEFHCIREITWQTGLPPPDRPVCGFSGIDGPCAPTGGGRNLILGTCLTLLCMGPVAVIMSWYYNNRKERKCDFAVFELTEALRFSTPMSTNSSFVD
ncbi:hypothetical protein BV898_13432 [Hypsibius exemplaris]|uniref:Receptor ligand binding region domain-containing protein n=1 Tax=Hypsibius exemplaris TaxID=2072580 RepID=A0A1W0WAU9_HYPEX|nr:hypothetical protein BV898_13432 [Hypsibius exemplaris]